VYTIRIGSDVAEAQIDGLPDAEVDLLLEWHRAVARSWHTGDLTDTPEEHLVIRQ